MPISIASFINRGILPHYDDIQRLRIRLFNVDNLVGIIFPLFILILFQLSGHFNSVSTLCVLFFSALSLLTYYLNSIYYHGAAAIIFLSCCSIALVIMALLFGKETEVYFYFLPISLSSFIYYLKNRITAWTFFSTQLAIFLLLYYLPYASLLDWKGANDQMFADFNIALATSLLGTKIVIFAQLFLQLLTKLRDREAKYRNIFETSQVGIAISSTVGFFSDVNPAFCQMLGYSREEFLQQSFKSITAPEDIGHSKQQVELILKDPHKTVKIQKTYLHKKGHPIRANTVLKGIYNEKGQFIGIMVNTQDITEQYEAQKALQDSHALLSATLESTAEGILAIDLNQKITRYNKKFIDMWKFPASILNGKEQMQAFEYIKLQLIDQKSFMNSIKSFNTEPERVLFDLLTLKDGRIFERYSQPQWIDNEIVGRVTSFRNVTARKRQEQIIQENITLLNQKNQELEKYIESNLQLENFAYIASHDLKAPVRTIVSFSQLLQKSAKEKLNEDENTFLDFIISATSNMQNLIEALLTFARVDTQKHQPHIIQLPKLLNEIETDLYSLITETNACIVKSNIPETIHGDITKIRQLFQNLIQNAIKFKKADVPPKIQISCVEQEKFWHFAIEDNGIGIAPEFHEKIFLLFRKLHNNQEGTGIGLALCKKIVEHHEGKIWVESTPGKGTIFYFTLKKTESNLADSVY